MTEQSETENADDIVQNFQLESSALRGRIIRLGGVIDDILTPHGYPKHITHLVAETTVLTGLLSSMLEYEGVFTMQTRGEGPVSLLVSDMTAKGDLRGCAHFDEERVSHAIEQLSVMKSTEGSQNHLAQLLGKGHIVFTVDPGTGKENMHQAIVELKGSSMVDCVQHYFTQTANIGTGIKMAVGQRDGKWRAAAIMLQNLPEEGQNTAAGTGNIDEDAWRRAMILLESCTEDELLDETLHPNELLLRLFHEDGVIVYPSLPVVKSCRCSEEKVENMLIMMPKDDRDYMAEDGQIKMRCEFCSDEFVFDANAIDRKIEKIKRDIESRKP